MPRDILRRLVLYKRQWSWQECAILEADFKSHSPAPLFFLAPIKNPYRMPKKLCLICVTSGKLINYRQQRTTRIR